MPAPSPPVDWPLVVADERPCDHDVSLAVLVDHVPWGAVARRDPDGTVWRALLRDDLPLLLSARPTAGRIALQAWAPSHARTDPTVVHELLMAWAGLCDDDAGADDVFAAHPLTRQLRRRMGPVRLSALPAVEEAVGRAVLGQLVQYKEAERSAAQLLRLAGTAVGHLWAWPPPARLRQVPSWDLRRRCGVSQRGATALHAAAASHARLARHAAERDWDALDARLRSLPGIGVWTSAEARLALGDADAVPFGDWHLPTLVGHALGGATPAGGWDDGHLAELLEPFRPHRGRALRLLLHGAMRGLGPRPARRAPRAALSAHRYW